MSKPGAAVTELASQLVVPIDLLRLLMTLTALSKLLELLHAIGT